MHTIVFVSGNEGKIEEVREWFTRYAPEINFNSYALEIEELQHLDLDVVLRHKALQAWSKLRCPLIVDDSGMTFAQYPGFPGVMTRPVIKTLGHAGLLKLAQDDNRIEHYAGLGYADERGNITTFVAKLAGRLVPPVQITSRMPNDYGLYARTIPEGFNKTMPELWDDWAARDTFPRARVCNEFVAWLKNKC